MATSTADDPMHESAPVMDVGGSPPHRVFHHLAAPKAHLYRVVLQLFTSAKERFEIALRPSEIVSRLTESSVSPRDLSEEEVVACLSTLCEWGNLSATRDVVSARTIEEYLHPKYLYQLTHAGEIAERALMVFEDGLLRPGELSASALRDIADTLSGTGGQCAKIDKIRPRMFSVCQDSHTDP